LCWHADKLHIRKECLEIFDKRFEEEFEAAMLTCSSLTEFRAKYTKFVWHLNRNLDKYKHNFIKQKFSTQQIICKIILEHLLGCSCLYNKRYILKGKELDIYFEKYRLAFEYDSYYWHDSKFVKTADVKKEKLCKKFKIKLIRIKEPYLNAHAKIQNAIQDIKVQIIENLSLINLICNKQFKKEDVANIVVNQDEILKNGYNTQYIIEAIAKCNSYAQFRLNYDKYYQYIRRFNLKHLLDELKTKDHRHMSKEQYFNYVLKECPTYSSFIKHKTYSFAYRRKYDKEIKNMFCNLNRLTA